MPAVTIEVLAAPFQRFRQMEPADRSATPLAGLVVQGDHDRRAVEAIDEARRDDADHAGVPTLAGKYDRAAIVAVELLLDDLRQRLVQDLALDRLPLAVLLFQVRCDLHRARQVRAGEHLD